MKDWIKIECQKMTFLTQKEIRMKKWLLGIVGIIFILSGVASAGGPSFSGGGGSSSSGSGDFMADGSVPMTGNLAVGAHNITMTGSLAATGNRVTKGWFTDLEITNAPTVNGAALTTILQPLDAELTALAGLTFADASIIQLTGTGASAVLTSGGNNYFLKSTSDNSAIEFATPANVLTAIGAQPLATPLTTISSLGTSNQLIGMNAAGDAVEYKSSISLILDDSAAQFQSATASKGTMKFDQTGIANTKLITQKWTAADSYTFTPTLLGNVTLGIGTTFTDGKWCSYATATGLTCGQDAPAGTGDVTKAGDCASGDCYDGSSDGGTYARLYDGTSAYMGITAGVRSVTFAPSNANAEDLKLTLGDNDNTATFSSSTGVTDVSLSALNFVTTGAIHGGIEIITADTSLSAAQCYGSIDVFTDAQTVALPAAVKGMNVMIYQSGAAILHVDPNSTDTITLDGVDLTAAHQIECSAAAGSFVTLVSFANNTWTVLGKSGTWTVHHE